ncbi:hypothetical protein D3C87_1610930 [compost metagenome]
MQEIPDLRAPDTVHQLLTGHVGDLGIQQVAICCLKQLISIQAPQLDSLGFDIRKVRLAIPLPVVALHRKAEAREDAIELLVIPSIQVIGPGSLVRAERMAKDSLLHLIRCVRQERACAAQDIGRLDVQLPTDLQPLVPANQEPKRHRSIEMLKHMVESDLVERARREVEIQDIGIQFDLSI